VEHAVAKANDAMEGQGQLGLMGVVFVTIERETGQAVSK